MAELSKHDGVTVKIYHGYGHQNNLIVYGHVLNGAAVVRKKYSNNPLTNIIHLARLFFVKPLANIKLTLQWQDQQLFGSSESDGFFKFEWRSTVPVAYGWHAVTVMARNDKNEII